MQGLSRRAASLAAVLVLIIALPSAGSFAQPSAGTTRGNAACPGEDVFYDPGAGQDIVVPAGYKVEVFAHDLNFPTAIAFQGDREHFQVLVLESGTGLPSRCNNADLSAFGGKFSADNPLTPDIKVFDQAGNLLRGPLGKPTAAGGGFQPDGPAIGLAFERVFQGGTLFATDSNQGVRGAPGQGNNTSRVLTVDPTTGQVSVFIDRLPTGDHPTEQILAKDGFIFWSQGSATNSGVTGHDNGAGGNQHDIPCQDVVLSNNLFDSGDGHLTSGFSNHGVARPGATVPAFEGAFGGMHACTGAILRARIDTPNPASTVEPFSWGYRNPFGIRFAPQDHPLKGKLFITENGEDERGARPTNNAPDRLQVAEPNRNGTPDFHGWPDRFGFLDSTQSVFNPVGGPGDDLCSAPVMPTFDPVACAKAVAAKDVPVKHVLASPPQPPRAPLGLEPADVAVVGPDFAPNGFTGGVVRRGAALVSREGDFGFSAPNGNPKEGHDVQLVNFSPAGEPLDLELSRFAFNCRAGDQRHLADGTADCANPADQAFVEHIHGINRPVTLMFGPDGAAYLVDFGAVRDFGQSNPAAKFNVAADAPLVQIPHTGTIWKITRVGARQGEEGDER